MEETLTLDPEQMRNQPVSSDQPQPEWVHALLAYLQDAADAGEVVSVSARVKTLTPAEVAERLGVSRATISRRIAAGEIRTIKVGNRHRVPVAEYDRFRKDLMQSMVDHYSADIAGDLVDE